MTTTLAARRQRAKALNEGRSKLSRGDICRKTAIKAASHGGVETKKEGARNVGLVRVAEWMYGESSYEVNPIVIRSASDKGGKATSLEGTHSDTLSKGVAPVQRSFEGTFLLFAAFAIITGLVVDRVVGPEAPELTIGACVVLPAILTVMQVWWIPHDVEETTVALALLALYFTVSAVVERVYQEVPVTM